MSNLRARAFAEGYLLVMEKAAAAPKTDWTQWFKQALTSWGESSQGLMDRLVGYFQGGAPQGAAQAPPAQAAKPQAKASPPAARSQKEDAQNYWDTVQEGRPIAPNEPPAGTYPPPRTGLPAGHYPRPAPALAQGPVDFTGMFPGTSQAFEIPQIAGPAPEPQYIGQDLSRHPSPDVARNNFINQQLARNYAAMGVPYPEPAQRVNGISQASRDANADWNQKNPLQSDQYYRDLGVANQARQRAAQQWAAQGIDANSPDSLGTRGINSHGAQVERAMTPEMQLWRASASSQ